VPAERARLTCLTTVRGPFAAHVLAARLTDEGFDVELRGPLRSAYMLGLNEMAEVDVYVPDDQVADASYVLLVTEVEQSLADEPPRPAFDGLWLARSVLALVLIAMLLPLVRAFA
jgi:hypothetical protein